MDEAQPLLDRLQRSAGRHQVLPRQQGAAGVDRNDVGADGADVYPEVADAAMRMRRDCGNRLRAPRRHQRRMAAGRLESAVEFSEDVQEAITRYETLVRLGAQCRTCGGQDREVLGNCDSAAVLGEYLAEGPHHPCIGCDSTHEAYRGSELLPAGDDALEVPRHSQAETRYDVLGRRAHLLEMDHVRLGEYAASARHPGRIGAFQREPAESFGVHPEAGRLLIEERTGSGGADGVHGEIVEDAFPAVRPEKQEFRVLPAHLYH